MQTKFSRSLLVKLLLVIIFTVLAVLLKGNKLSVTALVAQVADMLAFSLTDKTFSK